MSKRLDILLFEKQLAKSREASKSLIVNNQVYVDGKCISKPSFTCDENSLIEIKGEILKYVGRGGLKLEKAINSFKLNLKDKICMDIGASTGGFTDCMLQNGAKKVYSVDVGHGQLDPKLCADSRVINLENTNIRNIEKKDISDSIDFISIDVSFISLKLVLPKAKEFLSEKGEIIALIKPQFEYGKKLSNKNGIITKPQDHITILQDILSFCNDYFCVKNLTFSPIKGGEGNIEYLLHLSMSEEQSILIDIKNFVQQTFINLKGGEK